MVEEATGLHDIAFVGVSDEGEEVSFGFDTKDSQTLKFTCNTALLDRIIDRLELLQVDAHRKMGSPIARESAHIPLLVHGTHIEWMVAKDRSFAALEVRREREPPIQIRCHPEALSDLAAQAQNVLERFSSDKLH